VEKFNVKGIEFSDLYSIDSESLQQLEPVYGVIFLFKYGDVDRRYASEGNKPLNGEYDYEYQNNGLFFANQTIQNACGTQAVLNILLNKSEEIEIGEDLANFKSFVTGFDGEMIGETISNSDLIRSVHNSFSTPSSLVIDDDKKPPKNYDDKNDGLFHFVGYLRFNNHIYELDGLKSHPIRHAECNSQQEFCEKLPDVIQRRIAKYDSQELRFALLAITNNKLEYFQSVGDIEMVNSQLMKRETWHKENEMRKHDYTGLIVDLIKNISKEMTDDEWNVLLKEAGEKGQLGVLKSIARKQGLNL
jgi:ubiquitin carboxyl-terminal hydrolase L5